MIVGTAGHIDHGKSTLVAALTGRRMDRLAEEQRRGITIELNVAPLALPGGVTAGVVDVPGHEDFVRTMVAGASGIDVALLVVAADEGIMPQTEEHLLVLEQLGVAVGIPVLTKSDLVEPDWLELVALELGERLARSTVAFEEVIALSARTGSGLEALRARLALLAAALPPRRTDDGFRLPVDRAFSVAGIGTVITGTAWSGRVEVGDRVRILPGGIEGRVRTIESHGAARSASTPGARTALGLAGVERAAVERGQVVVSDALPWAETRSVDVELRLAPTAPRALLTRSRVRLHVGTAEVMARVRTAAPIAPGECGLARLLLETPVVVRGGDRLVLRSYSPVTTIGGGRVLDPLPPRRARRPTPALAHPDPAERMVALLERRGGVADQGALALLVGVPPTAIAALVAGDRRVLVAGNLVLLEAVVSDVKGAALRLVRDHHRRAPDERGPSLETIRSALDRPAALVEAALGGLAAERRIVIGGGIAALAGFSPRLPPGAEVELVLAELERGGLTPPSVAELEATLGRRDVAQMLRFAAASGRVEAVERDRYYTRAALDRFGAAVRLLGERGEFTPGALRDLLGVSRKYLIPLLEWSDRQGLTLRTGEARRLGSRAT